MKYLLIFLAGFLILFSGVVSVSADWSCGGDEYLDCGSDFPQECCVQGNIAACLSNSQDCAERCCTGSGCDDWQDFRYCDSPDVANCEVDSPYGYDMVCCSPEFPVWNDDYQRCWESDWDCTDNSHCSGSDVCEDNQCVTGNIGECNTKFDCSIQVITTNDCSDDNTKITKSVTETGCVDHTCIPQLVEENTLVEDCEAVDEVCALDENESPVCMEKEKQNELKKQNELIFAYIAIAVIVIFLIMRFRRE